MTTKKYPQVQHDLENVDSSHILDVQSKPAPNEDPTARSTEVSPTKQRFSSLWTILCAGCALISDGYSNSLMAMINVVLRSQYPREYTSAVSTRVSNALLVGQIVGQVTIG